jgi:hypothetical protein
MSLGDFIGSLQFYPWRERMLMPEEEPVERIPADIARATVTNLEKDRLEKGPAVRGTQRGGVKVGLDAARNHDNLDRSP